MLARLKQTSAPASEGDVVTASLSLSRRRKSRATTPQQQSSTKRTPNPSSAAAAAADGAAAKLAMAYATDSRRRRRRRKSRSRSRQPNTRRTPLKADEDTVPQQSAEHVDEESKTNKFIWRLRQSNSKLTKRLQAAQLLQYDDYRVKAIRSLKANVRILTSQVDVLKHELKLRGVGDETIQRSLVEAMQKPRLSHT